MSFGASGMELMAEIERQLAQTLNSIHAVLAEMTPVGALSGENEIDSVEQWPESHSKAQCIDDLSALARELLIETQSIAIDPDFTSCQRISEELHVSLCGLKDTHTSEKQLPDAIHQIQTTIRMLHIDNESATKSPLKSSSSTDFHTACRANIPSYRIATKGKPRTQNFHRYLQRKPLSSAPPHPKAQDSLPVDAIAADCQLSTGWMEWAGKRPCPLHVSAFLDVLRGQSHLEDVDSVGYLMRHVNVYFHLTPSTKKNSSMHASLMHSIYPKPMSKLFRSRIQVMLEEIAANFHLETSHLTISESVKTENEACRKRRLASPKHEETYAFLLQTTAEIHKQHYSARLYDEVHFAEHVDAHRMELSGKIPPRSQRRTAKRPGSPLTSRKTSESLVFHFPSCIRTFIEWLRPGKYALFLIHWIMLCVLKRDGREKRTNHTQLVPKVFLKAAKSWAARRETNSHNGRPHIDERGDLDATEPLLVILPNSTSMIRHIMQCTDAYIAAEKLSQTIANLREKGLGGCAKRGAHDSLSLLELHEKRFHSLSIDRAHSRLSTRTAAESSPNVYKDIPADFSAENFSPALLRASQLRSALHAMEASLDAKESTSEISTPLNSTIHEGEITSRALNGIQGAIGDPCQVTHRIQTFRGMDDRVCTVRPIDTEHQNRWLDTKYRARKIDRDDVPWDAVSANATEDSASHVAFYNRVDRCGYAFATLRVEALGGNGYVEDREGQ